MTEKATKKIQCPHCGCNPRGGFALVEHLDTEDDEIKDVYFCPKCGKKSVRCYKFTKWESIEAKKIIKNTLHSIPIPKTHIGSSLKGLQKW